MRFLLSSALLLIGLKAQASSSLTQIHDINLGSESEPTLVFLTNGLAARIDSQDEVILDQLKVAQAQGAWINVTLDEDKYIYAMESSEGPIQEPVEETIEEKSINYTPSIIPSYNQARAVFKKMNRRYNDESQCYNRAHVWSWEMYQKHHIYSMKSFVFFTPKYIRKYAFDWWFHVAPMVHVNEEGRVVERVMDFRYSNGPKTMKEWTDIFMHNNATCTDVAKYTDYEYTRSNADAPWCMLLKVPMYYYQPLDLEAMDKQNKIRDFWEEWEVGNAYREAFDYRRGI